MSIIFVMGAACSGKSTFIAEHFPNYKVIDLFDFQSKTLPTYDSIWKSYIACADKLKECIKRGNKNIILEHTLMTRIRREWYIEQVREVTNEDIEIYCLVPSAEQLVKQSQLRGNSISKDVAKALLNVVEIPIKEEGFSKVTIIKT